MINIISSLDSNKSTGPNSIRTKILKLLKNDISTQLSDIFNVSFPTGAFPSILKIAKVVPIGHVHEYQPLFEGTVAKLTLINNLSIIISSEQNSGKYTV